MDESLVYWRYGKYVFRVACTPSTSFGWRLYWGCLIINAWRFVISFWWRSATDVGWK